ncbi:MAG: 50S ribosomal protein L2 [Gammaproteobacteria bacterium]|nr:50S ribosomal protein L2 [Gammaproteobacteria bacterium]|tara:strand:+ start:26233 stop:27069 length:837 start_codon:yes stop_codon:yes gene_type:complete
MTLIKSKPTSPGRRFRVKISDVDLYKGKPYKPLIEKNKKTGGRNNQGRITTRHIGGGHKKKYRIIDFKRDKENMPAKVERLEYDPNRNANIALIQYDDGERRYIIAPKDLKIGDTVISGSNSAISVGNTLPLKEIPVGTQVHCIEMKPGKGAQIARAAGTVAQIVAMEGNYVTVKLRSGELRKILNKCKATIGEVGNSEYNLQAHGKAGAKRWLGIRPTVRGVAMNPIDHPHGGGEGKTSGGRDPVSPKGVPTKGFKTRSNKRTNNMIVKRRTNKKRK